MKKRQILKALSLLAVVCITAGCNASTAVETTTTAAEITTTTTAEETGQTDSNSELPELEVDYVDEYGGVFYKNPANWDYERIFEKLKINGKKFEAPLTIKKIGNEFSISEDSISYINDEKALSAFLLSNEEEIGVVHLYNSSDSKSDYEKEILYIHSSSMFMKDKDKAIDISIGGIGINSSEESVIKTLGTPQSISYMEDVSYASYKYGNDNCLICLICENGLVSSIHLSFGKE